MTTKCREQGVSSGRKKTRVGGLGWVGELGLLLLGVLVLKGLDVGGKERVQLATGGIGGYLFVPVVILCFLVSGGHAANGTSMTMPRDSGGGAF